MGCPSGGSAGRTTVAAGSTITATCACRRPAAGGAPDHGTEVQRRLVLGCRQAFVVVEDPAGPGRVSERPQVGPATIRRAGAGGVVELGTGVVPGTPQQALVATELLAQK